MVEIREVISKADLKKFVLFPNRMYKDVPQYIPPFVSDEMDDWDRKKNPAFSYCDAKCWLAWRDGEIVGRIAAILSHKANEKWNTKRMRFTLVDFIDDFEVSSALFKTVEDYARQMGCNEVHGPIGFTDMDREGMLVEGFDQKSMFITYYNHPYYIDHMKRLGYGKDVDWVEFLIRIPEPDEPLANKIHRLGERVQRMTGLRVAELKSRKDYGPYVQKVFNLANTCYAGLYGTVPFTDEQVKKYADKFIPMINPELACFVMDDNDDMIAFGISAPSMASALKKIDGKMFPLGFIEVLKALKTNDTLDLFLIAVRPDYQNKGVNAILMSHIMKGCHKMGIKQAETGPQLELNEKVQHQWNMFDYKTHKRRRCWIKEV
ncbi:MAG: GNAT family N-acetyltransferase [Clostridia bacterium]|nr:GNAT family N-acetyltransferase [Clostridia bacterium]